MATNFGSLRLAQVPLSCHFCNKKAIHWKCKECDVFMCTNCKEKIHQRLKSAKHHAIVSVLDIWNDNPAQSNVSSEASRHPSTISPISGFVVPNKETRTLKQAQTPIEKRNESHEVVIDFLRRSMHGLIKVAHAEGNDKSDLDRETEGYIRQNVTDIKMPKASRLSPTRTISSVSRLVMAPTPSRKSKTLKQAQTSIEKRNERHAVVISLLRLAMHGLGKVAHAEGNDQTDLDRKTEGYITQNVTDIKMSQRELFGRILDPGEFAKFPPKKQNVTNEKMRKLLQKWEEERRTKEQETSLHTDTSICVTL